MHAINGKRPRTPAALLVLGMGLAVVLQRPVQAQECAQRSTWPRVDWDQDLASTAQTRAAQIQALEKYAFTLEGSDEERRGIRSDSAVIIAAGKLIYEKYARGYGADKRHLAWSASKSVTAALVGVAVSQGALHLDDSICQHLTIESADNCVIKVKHLLEMGSGLDWQEVYEDQSNQASSVLAMLYGQGHDDMASFVAEHKRHKDPGMHFRYSTGESVLLAAVANAAMRPVAGDEWPWTLLFDRIGMRSATFERDSHGNYIGGSFFYATPRDFARFGYLFLNDGCWRGQRLLPVTWVSDARTVADAFRNGTQDGGETWVYGRHWWLNVPVAEQGISKPFPSLPDDTFVAAGHWGQYVVVIPSLDLVVVRTGDDRDGSFDLDTFTKLAIEIAR